jgi:hypothetical protein
VSQVSRGASARDGDGRGRTPRLNAGRLVMHAPMWPDEGCNDLDAHTASRRCAAIPLPTYSHHPFPVTFTAARAAAARVAARLGAGGGPPQLTIATNLSYMYLEAFEPDAPRSPRCRLRFLYHVSIFDTLYRNSIQFGARCIRAISRRRKRSKRSQPHPPSPT